MKPISTKQHGVVDYLFAGSVYALRRSLPVSERSSRLLGATAAGTVAVSALTRYELGLVKVLPMKGHLALDYVIDALFLGAPLLLREEDRRVTRAMAALGAVGTVVALLSETESSRA